MTHKSTATLFVELFKRAIYGEPNGRLQANGSQWDGYGATKKLDDWMTDAETGSGPGPGPSPGCRWPITGDLSTDHHPGARAPSLAPAHSPFQELPPAAFGPGVTIAGCALAAAAAVLWLSESAGPFEAVSVGRGRDAVRQSGRSPVCAV